MQTRKDLSYPLNLKEETVLYQNNILKNKRDISVPIQEYVSIAKKYLLEVLCAQKSHPEFKYILIENFDENHLYNTIENLLSTSLNITDYGSMFFTSRNAFLNDCIRNMMLDNKDFPPLKLWDNGIIPTCSFKDEEFETMILRLHDMSENGNVIYEKVV